MAQEALYQFLIEVLQQIANDIVTLLPKVILAIIVIIIAFLTIKLINRIFRRILELISLDSIFSKLAKTKLPFSPSSLIIALIDIGIILIAIFGIANFLLGSQYIELMRGMLGYGARIISVIAVIIFTFIMFNLLIERIHIESRMRGYVVFILLILITIMAIDLTALSSSAKQALESGLSIGLGIAVGIFAVWFFFHDYLDKFFKIKTASRGRKKQT